MFAAGNSTAPLSCIRPEQNELGVCTFRRCICLKKLLTGFVVRIPVTVGHRVRVTKHRALKCRCMIDLVDSVGGCSSNTTAVACRMLGTINGKTRIFICSGRCPSGTFEENDLEGLKFVGRKTIGGERTGTATVLHKMIASDKVQEKGDFNGNLVKTPGDFMIFEHIERVSPRQQADLAQRALQQPIRLA